MLPLVLFAFGHGAAGENRIQDLRNDVADRFFDAAPHFALAKYHHDRGDRILAFYILENARRTRIERAVFDAEFRRVFRDSTPFDNSPEAENTLLRKVAVGAAGAEDLTKLADIYISRDDWTPAQRYLRRVLRKRGLAAYLAVNRRRHEAFPLMREFLASHSQLLRFDAISSLVMEGGPEGRAIVLAHRAREEHPWLQKLLQSIAEH